MDPNAWGVTPAQYQQRQEQEQQRYQQQKQEAEAALALKRQQVVLHAVRDGAAR